MEAKYLNQSRLVVAVLPFVAKEEAFALKGGTAINLFENDLSSTDVVEPSERSNVDSSP